MTPDEIADRIARSTPEQRYDWTGLPHWAAYGGEHFDNGWVPDCGGKVDYDPGLLRISSRVYSDGAWTASVYFGADFEIEETGIRHAESKEAAKLAVQVWADDASKRWANVIAATLRARVGA